MRPMLATQGDHACPRGPGWVHEVKWDGMRVIVSVTSGGRLRIASRNENDVTVSFPELAGPGGPVGGRRPRHRARRRGGRVRRQRRARASARWPTASTSRTPAGPRTRRGPQPGHAAWSSTCSRSTASTSPGCRGRTAARPWRGWSSQGRHWQVPPTYDDGAVLLEATLAQGLEGVVSKRRSLAVPSRAALEGLAEVPAPPLRLVRRRGLASGDRRSATGSVRCWWGSRPPTGWSTAAGSAAGWPARRGSGWRRCWSRWPPSASPFLGPGAARGRASARVWVRPELVVEVASLGLTPQQRLRQPAYLGVRSDLRAGDLPRPGGGDDG